LQESDIPKKAGIQGGLREKNQVESFEKDDAACVLTLVSFELPTVSPFLFKMEFCHLKI